MTDRLKRKSSLDDTGFAWMRSESNGTAASHADFLPLGDSKRVCSHSTTYSRGPSIFEPPLPPSAVPGGQVLPKSTTGTVLWEPSMGNTSHPAATQGELPNALHPLQPQMLQSLIQQQQHQQQLHMSWEQQQQQQHQQQQQQAFAAHSATSSATLMPFQTPPPNLAACAFGSNSGLQDFGNCTGVVHSSAREPSNEISMEEDDGGSGGMKHSNSAPDLHMLLGGTLPSYPRSWLQSRQSFGGGSGGVGALVPYQATEDVIQSCKDYSFRQQLLESLRDPRVRAHLTADPAALQMLNSFIADGQHAMGTSVSRRAPSHVVIEEMDGAPLVGASTCPDAPTAPVYSREIGPLSSRVPSMYPRSREMFGYAPAEQLQWKGKASVTLPVSKQRQSALGVKRKAEWSDSEGDKRAKMDAEHSTADMPGTAMEID